MVISQAAAAAFLRCHQFYQRSWYICYVFLNSQINQEKKNSFIGTFLSYKHSKNGKKIENLTGHHQTFFPTVTLGLLKVAGPGSRVFFSWWTRCPFPTLLFHTSGGQMKNVTKHKQMMHVHNVHVDSKTVQQSHTQLFLFFCCLTGILVKTGPRRHHSQDAWFLHYELS